MKSEKINGNLWKSMKTMEVLRWQEASLESSKGFYKGIRSVLTVVRPHARTSMQIHENPSKSMQIFEINGNQKKTMKVLRWQEASLESSKGFYRGSRSYLTVARPHARKSMKIHEIPLKSMKIYENLWKSKENNESPQMTRRSAQMWLPTIYRASAPCMM